MSNYNQFSARGAKCISFLILIYGHTIYYTSFIFYKICRTIIAYYPEKCVPDKFLFNPPDVNIQNIQYVSETSDSASELIDITKKGKILIKMLWDDKMKLNGGFMLHELVKYLTNCTLLYIDYQMKKDPKSKYINVKKIIDTSVSNRPTYVEEKRKTEIPFGEVVF